MKLPSRADSPLILASWGELLDKLSILDIKSERIVAPHARLHSPIKRARAAQQAAAIANCRRRAQRLRAH